MTGPDLELRLAAGFLVVFSSTLALNKAGDYLYHWGIVKPFYFLGHRIHHKNFLVAIIPGAYVVLAMLVYLHYVRILWYSFWPSIEITMLLVAACLAIDLTFDAMSSPDKRRALFHHEWVYFVVPAYAFTHLVALV